MGMIYKRGNVWWIKYYRNGKYYRESSGSTKKMVAKKILDRREGDIAQGKIPGIQFEKVTFDELAEEFITDYRINNRKSLDRAELSVKHLAQEFEGLRIPDITTPRIQEYIFDRMKWMCKGCEKMFRIKNELKCPKCGGDKLVKGAANATINRELSALKRLLNLGAQQTPPKVAYVPHIPMLRENNVRKGFFEYKEFISVRNELPDYLKGFFTFAYKTGWRFSEIAKLTWNRIDIEKGVVRLETVDTKNDTAREIYLDHELRGIINLQYLKHNENTPLIPYVFLNSTCAGRVAKFRKNWHKACKKAGVNHRFFHDLRRTAVRDMVRSGITERVVMMVSGHKTRSVFDRYNIVNDEDLRIATDKREKYAKIQVGAVTGTVTGTINEISDASNKIEL